jgi:hypothetical protein
MHHQRRYTKLRTYRRYVQNVELIKIVILLVIRDSTGLFERVNCEGLKFQQYIFISHVPYIYVLYELSVTCIINYQHKLLT